jgi:hypothetical protein
MQNGSPESPDRILNSWKEISEYLGRGIRTVQRWESLYGMPVHRPAGHPRSAVVTTTRELDHWLTSPALTKRLAGEANALIGQSLSRLQERFETMQVKLESTRLQMNEVRSRSVALRQQIRASRDSHTAARQRLRSSAALARLD